MTDFLIVGLAIATAGNAWIGWADKRRLHKAIAIFGALALLVAFLF